ncbi:spartin a [Betta splendens]|uniref:Spartin a n=1 Tax=Betta splendens TaxID=158456 RepID=A0A6P7PE60_BETSP|nr:spartin a [Betta splendens]XP_029030496.1 spartin a [Betta splendens]
MDEPAELLLIKDQYELAFHALSRGLTAEEAGRTAEALKCYTNGQQHLLQGLQVPTWGQERAGGAVGWDKARRLQQRMRQTLATVNSHLSDLQTWGATAGERRGRLLSELPHDLYPELKLSAQPPPGSVRPLHPSTPATARTTAPVRPLRPAAPHRPALGPMASPWDQPPAYTPQPADGRRSLRSGAAARREEDELLFIPSGVQVFLVAPDGEVRSALCPGFLRIVTCRRQNKDSSAQSPSALLNVCGRVFPLAADTPVLLADSGVFMLPDALAETPGSFVGLVLSSELPAADREMFQDVLSQLVDLRVQGSDGAGAEVPNLSTKVPLGPSKRKPDEMLPNGETEKAPLPGWSEKMGRGILSGSMRLSQSFAKGAEATGRAIQKGGGKIRDRVTPEETPTVVSPRVTQGLETTQQVTGGAVRVSRFLVNGLSTVIGQVAEKMAPHVKKHGAKMVPESMKKNQDGRPSNLDGAKFVAVSSAKGLSAIWSSLETGAKLVCKSMATETVTTVKHKYGDEAAQATDTGLRSAANVGVAAYNIDNLGTIAIMNAVEKKTSKNSIEGPKEGPKDADTKEEHMKK